MAHASSAIMMMLPAVTAPPAGIRASVAADVARLGTGVQQRALDGGAMAIGDIDTDVGAEALAAAMAQIALSEPHSPSG
jgi:hypothetical protein